MERVSIRRIFLITVDCLRADYVGCISGCSLTPNIDRFARDSVVFTRAFSNGPATTQSFTAILTSTYFLIHGDMSLSPHFTTLARVLSNNGFRTVAFHSNPFLSRKLGWDNGFNEFYDFMDVVKIPSAAVIRLDRSAKLIGAISKITGPFIRNKRLQSILRTVYYTRSNLEIPYVEGRELNNNVIKWINQHKEKKFFLWMHYMDPHRPYIPPNYSQYFGSRREALMFDISIHSRIMRGDVSKGELEKLKWLYAKEVEYVDKCIGEFLDFLEQLNILESSLIILTADHGEPFMEHKKIEHNYDIIYNEAIHVPLIIYGLTDDHRTINDNAQLLDVPPTIVDALGIKKPKDFIGKSLIRIWKEKQGCGPIFSESAKPDLINLTYDTRKKVISCITEDWKLIINEFWDTIELYNINKDFREKNNLAESELEVVKRLTTIIQNHLAYETSYRHKLKAKKIRKRLKALSYLQ